MSPHAAATHARSCADQPHVAVLVPGGIAPAEAADAIRDMVVRGASDEPTKPARDYFKFASGGMVAELDSASSRYVTHIYDQAKVLEEAYATYNKLKKDGKVEEAKEYREDNKEKLDRYRSVENIKQQMSALNEKIRMIERDTRKDPDKKRAEINYLRRQQDRISRKLAPTS